MAPRQTRARYRPLHLLLDGGDFLRVFAGFHGAEAEESHWPWSTSGADACWIQVITPRVSNRDGKGWIPTQAFDNGLTSKIRDA